MFFFLRRPNSRRRSLFCYAKPAGLLTLPNYQHLPVRWTVAFSLITEWAYSSGFCSGFSPDSLFISLHYCQENQISVCKIIPFISIDQIFGLFFADLSRSAFSLTHKRRQSRRFKVPSSRVAHRRQQSCSSRFKVQGSKPNGLSRFSHRGGEAAVPSSRFKVQTQRSCWFKVQMRWSAFKVQERPWPLYVVDVA